MDTRQLEELIAEARALQIDPQTHPQHAADLEFIEKCASERLRQSSDIALAASISREDPWLNAGEIAQILTKARREHEKIQLSIERAIGSGA